ncbi:9614_t:CDS:2 [Paraglomus occultum]|uniref:9614_t:CDS:1 n=1 Tax=Paraglomus occultum TaxID=144539 RepID=A0A9N9C234_9GLOM|nr:9614_t:CDS:2 [Paraglomus occultum]
MITTASFRLNNGVEMPACGLGTYRIKQPEIIDSVVRQAVKCGYRLVDSAAVYKNEEAIGKTIRSIIEDTSSGLRREDFFITSKLAPRDHGFETAYNACLTSLKKLDLGYLDLFLIHWPGSQRLTQDNPRNKVNRQQSYKALEKLYGEGKVRAIGISNYTLAHLEDLLTYASITPQVHQFEVHPLLYQTELIDFCKRYNILVQAYSSLGEGKLVDGSHNIEGVETMAQKHGVSEAQVYLRWGYQHGFGVIPKSTNLQRIQKNSEIFHFELDDESAITNKTLLSNFKISAPKREFWLPLNHKIIPTHVQESFVSVKRSTYHSRTPLSTSRSFPIGRINQNYTSLIIDASRETRRILKYFGIGLVTIGLLTLITWRGIHLYIEYFYHSTPSTLPRLARDCLRGAYVREEFYPDSHLAEQYLQHALRIAIQEQQLPPDDPIVLDIILRMANNSAMIENYHDALTRYESVWQILVDSGTEENVVKAIEVSKKVSWVCINMHDYEKAEKYLRWSIGSMSQKGDAGSTVPAIMNTDFIEHMLLLAGIYAQQKHYNKALALYAGILKQLKETPNRSDQSFICYEAIIKGHIGEILFGQNKLDDAMGWLQQGLLLTKQGSGMRACDECAGVIFNNLGTIHESRGQMEDAKEFYQKAVGYAKKAGDVRGIDEFQKRLDDIDQKTASQKSG